MKIATLPVLLFVASAAACGRAPEPAAEASEPLALSLAAAETTEAGEGFEAGGAVRARATAAIASRIMAPVAEVHVRPGDRVVRGQPLVTLDGREGRAHHARAAAAVAAAVETAQAAESDIRAAAAGLDLARASHDRIRTLHGQRSATPQELDHAAAGLAAADAQLAAARARAAAAAASRDAALAGRDAAEVAVSYAVLRAPFDGVVSERAVDPGSMAAPGAHLVTIEDPSAFRLEVRLDEARAAAVAPGQEVEFQIDALGAAGWDRGRVVEIARVDPASHSFVVKVGMPAAPGLRSGLFGRARFPGPPRVALTLPASAVLRRGQLTFAFRVDEGGVARLTPVSIGADLPGRAEILAGVREGDLVVADPPATLADGARVAPPRDGRTGDGR